MGHSQAAKPAPVATGNRLRNADQLGCEISGNDTGTDGNRQAVKYPAQAKWKRDNPQKVWAHRAFMSALRAGLVERQPCEVCGAEPAEAHHTDYNRPLFVSFFCRLHHKAEHAKLKSAGR